jgi:hypothetical protein
MNSIQLLLAIAIIFTSIISKIITIYHETGVVEAESRLLKKLFQNYDKFLRPADTVEIKFSLYLNQIITLIEREQIIVLNAFLDHEWIDGLNYK